MSLLATVLPWGVAVLVLAMGLNGWRLMKGPALVDRILALDTLYINTIALLVLLGMQRATAMYFEAALLIALLGFVGTVVLSKFLLRGDIVE